MDIRRSQSQTTAAASAATKSAKPVATKSGAAKSASAAALRGGTRARLPPAAGLCRLCFGRTHQIRIGSVVGLSANQKRGDACVAPLLLGRTGSMPRPPCGEASVVAGPDKGKRNTGDLGFLLERLGSLDSQGGEASLQRRHIRRRTSGDADICKEARVRRWIFPILCTKVFDFLSPLGFLRCRKPRVVLLRMVLFSFTCTRHLSTFPTFNPSFS